jgi:hypothetical protein
MIKGTAKFDGITIGEFTAEFMGPTLHLTAKAAFVNSRSGDTHGWTTNKTWSPSVIDKLRELKLLMEIDLAAIHLDYVELVSAPITSTPSHSSREPGGIGEHVGDGAVPQL